MVRPSYKGAPHPNPLPEGEGVWAEDYGLKRSNLLLGGFCSTVPGLVQVRNWSTPQSDNGFRHRHSRQTSGLVRRGPQACENLVPTCCLSLTTLDQFERLVTELIDTRIRVHPTVRQGTGI